MMLEKYARTFRFLLFILVIPFVSGFASIDEPQKLDIAILGLGGRAQILLTECLKLKEIANKEIRVVAVCDDHIDESLSAYTQLLEHVAGLPVSQEYKKMFETTQIYPDTEEGLNRLFQEHPHLDRVMIASTNDRHYDHITSIFKYSTCRDIFLEKPLFKSLNEYLSFGMQTDEARIHVGLVLRYAPMTKIVIDRMNEFKNRLGNLREIHSKEYVEFAKGMTLFMMNWRRLHSVSGGFLLDKSVHDLDLTLFFMQNLRIFPKTLNISTQFSHDFFKKSNQDRITQRILADEALQKHVEYWRGLPYQRVIDFAYEDSNKIDWVKTFDTFFKDFPEDDNFASSDLIPDHQTVLVEIRTDDEQTIHYSHDVKFNEFALKPQREIHLTFEHGEVIADIDHSKLTIILGGKTVLEEDLCTNYVTHAGGNSFVAQAILGTLTFENHSATFNDPMVQLSNLIALISEDQVRHNKTGSEQIIKSDKSWTVLRGCL